jgi:hypothetical protein
MKQAKEILFGRQKADSQATLNEIHIHETVEQQEEMILKINPEPLNEKRPMIEEIEERDTVENDLINPKYQLKTNASELELSILLPEVVLFI